MIYPPPRARPQLYSGNTLTFNVNNVTVTHVLNAGVNFQQFNLNAPITKPSIVITFRDNATRKTITNATVQVAVPNRQYAKTFKTDTMGKIKIDSKNTTITETDNIQVTLIDSRYQQKTQVF
jgi:hypothetical protein